MKAVLVAACAAVATTAHAAPVSYTLDPDHTIPRFEILHNGFSNHIGLFNKAAGKATQKPASTSTPKASGKSVAKASGKTSPTS